MNRHTYKCQLVLLGHGHTHSMHPSPCNGGVGPGLAPSGRELWAVAAGWPGAAARLAAHLQGRVRAQGHLAGAEGHACIKLGLEQLQLLHRLQGLWGDLSPTPQKVVVLTGVLG